MRLYRKRDVRKKTAAIFLILALLMVLFFTFQNPQKSRILSESVRMWLGNIGIQVEYKSLRSNIHILEYFIVGLAVCGYCRSRGWKNWVGMIAGFGIGVVDECVKTLLPGREFSTGDLIRDFVGVAVGVCFVEAFRLIRLLIGREKSR